MSRVRIRGEGPLQPNKKNDRKWSLLVKREPSVGQEKPVDKGATRLIVMKYRGNNIVVIWEIELLAGSILVT